jgi:carbon storage regulator
LPGKIFAILAARAKDLHQRRCGRAAQRFRIFFQEEKCMLVLSRKPQEEIVIDGQIRITVVEITGGRVKIGVSAPPAITVHRAEISDRIARNARRATAAPACGSPA